jgi:hypothetical protein
MTKLDLKLGASDLTASAQGSASSGYERRRRKACQTGRAFGPTPFGVAGVGEVCGERWEEEEETGREREW